MVVIKAVLFDFGGTLFDYHPPNNEIWARVAKQFGYSIHSEEPGLIKAIVDQRERFESLRVAVIDGKKNKITPDDWHEMNRITLRSLGIDDPEAVSVVSQMFDKRIGQFKIYPDTEDTLLKLKSEGIKLALVSNVSPDLAIPRRSILKEHGIHDLFSTIILSSEVGIEKPDPVIFNQALEKLGIDDPVEVIHVGDDIITDVRGSREAGINPVLFDPTGLRRADCDIISSISGIIPVINRYREKM